MDFTPLNNAERQMERVRETTLSKKGEDIAMTDSVSSNSADAVPDRGIRDGIRSARQLETYPHGRTRLELQLAGGDEEQAAILNWLTKLPRNGKRSRHGMIWRLIVAGWRSLTVNGGVPPDDLEATPKPRKGKQ